jgi:hypothetical protein
MSPILKRLRPKPHWTPKYVYDRISLELWQRTHPNSPWLTRESITLIKHRLTPHSVGFEWGSGRSTVWFAAQVAKLTSVEHDPAWTKTVQARLNSLGLMDRVTYHLCPDGQNESPNTDYVQVIHQAGDASLDFCLVDGVCRPWCALASLAKIKPGGLLIIDNANWFLPAPKPTSAPNSIGNHHEVSEPWRIFQAATALWHSVWTSDGVTCTLLLTAPHAAPDNAGRGSYLRHS